LARYSGLLRSGATPVHADLKHAGLDSWAVHRRVRDLVELVDDGPRSAFWQEKCSPGGDIKTGQPLLVRGRQIRHQRSAPARQHGDRLHLFAGDQRRRCAEIAAQVVDLPADQIVRSRRRATIGHMRDVDSDLGVEQRAGQMRGRAGAGGSILHLTGVCLQQRNELRDGACGKIVADFEHHRLLGEQRDGGEIVDGVVAPLL